MKPPELYIPEPFLQKHLEAFQVSLQKQSDEEDLVLSVYRGMVLKAAMDAGWMDKVDVGEMEVSEVVRLSADIQDAVSEATAIPKN